MDRNVNKNDANGSIRSTIFQGLFIIDVMENSIPSKKKMMENEITWVWVVSSIPERVFAYFSGISKSSFVSDPR